MENGEARAGTGASGSGRDSSSVDGGELHFLLLHYLRSLPGGAADAFEREATAAGLLPRREDPFGQSHAQSYEEIKSKYPHITHDHLLRLVRLTVSDTKQGKSIAVKGLSTLLGEGSASLVGGSGAEGTEGSGALNRSDHSADENTQGGLKGGGQRVLGGRSIDSSFHGAIDAARFFGTQSLRRPSTLLPTSLFGSRVNPLTTIKGHRKELYCVIFDKTGTKIITGSDDTLVKIWCSSTGTLRHALRGHTGEISFLDVNCTNTLIASASFDYTIRTWFLDSGVPCATLLGHANIVSEVRFSPTNSKILLSASWDQTLRVWDAFADSANSPPLVLNLKVQGTEGTAILNRTGGTRTAPVVTPAVAVAETPEEQRLAATAAAAAARAAQDAAAEAALSGVQQIEPDVPVGAVMCMVWSKDGTMFACGTTTCKMHMWSIPECVLGDDEGDETSNARVDPASITFIPMVGGHLHDVTSCAFSNCGELLLSSSRDGQAKIWERGFLNEASKEKVSKKSAPVEKNKRLGSWRVRCVLTTPADSEALRRQARQRRAPAVYAVEQAVWSCDDSTVLTAMSDFTVRVWRVSTGTLTHTARLHTNKVHVLQCHPFDSRLAMSAGHDGKVAVWDVEKGRCVRMYDGGEFDTLVLDGQWSPTGSTIVVSDEKGQWCLFGTGCGVGFSRAKHEQFFESEFVPETEIARDVATGSLSLAANDDIPFHTQFAHRNRLVDSLGNPYGEPYQSFFRKRKLIGNVASSGVRSEPPRPVGPREAEEATAAAAAAAATAAAAAAAATIITYRDDEEDVHVEEDNDDDDDEVVIVESDDEEASDSDFAQQRRVRRAGNAGNWQQRRAGNPPSPSGSDDPALNMGRAARATRREQARVLEVARRAARCAAQRRTNRSRRPTRRLIGDESETETDTEDEEDDDKDQVDRRTTGRQRNRPKRLGVVDGDDDDSEFDDEVPAGGEAAPRTAVRFTMKRTERDDENFASGSRNVRQRVDTDDSNQRPYTSYSWLLTDATQLGDSYVPQLGDELVYVAHGHFLYLEGRADKFASRPWLTAGVTVGGTRHSFRHVEPCRVVSLSYQISDANSSEETIAVVTLLLTDAINSHPSPIEFEIELPKLEECDFLIPAHRFRAAQKKKWKMNNHCAVPWQDHDQHGSLVNVWYHGVVVGEDGGGSAAGSSGGAGSSSGSNGSNQWSSSPWNKLKIEYYNITDPKDKVQEHSFWELHDEKVLRSGSQGSTKGDFEAQRIDDQTSRKLGDRVRRARDKLPYDVFSDEIGNEVRYPQKDGSVRNYVSMIPVPMSLDLIYRRLKHKWYRHVSGFAHDVEVLVSNCVAFNGEDSEYTELARQLQQDLTTGGFDITAFEGIKDLPVNGIEHYPAIPQWGSVGVSPSGRGRRR